MNLLTIAELEQLVEEHTPEEIRNKYGDRLTEEAQAFLKSHQEALEQVTDYLDDAGQSWREALPEVDTDGLALPSGYDARPFWHRRVSVAFSMLGAAATLCLGLLLPRPWTDKLESPSTHRTRSSGLVDAKLREEDNKLYKALMSHGQALIEMGQTTKNWDYYAEAAQDLTKAAAIKPEEKDPLEFLVIVYEKLNEKRMLEQVLQRLDGMDHKDTELE